MMSVDEENEQLRAAAREVLDVFDQGDTREALHAAMMKLRSTAGITARSEQIEEERLAVYRTLTGAGLTRGQLFWGAVLILFWFTMDLIGFVLDHVVPLFK